MPFSHTGVLRQPLETEQLRPQYAVLYIGLGAMAEDGWRIGVKNAYVVEHGSLVEELQVNLPSGVRPGYAFGSVGDILAVTEEQLFQLRLR